MANPVVTITMTNGDVMKAELYPEIAPNTVNNFISLVQKGFYDNYYMVEMGKMALYLVPSLLLGLLLRKPIIKLNNAFIEKLESTKLI